MSDTQQLLDVLHRIHSNCEDFVRYTATVGRTASDTQQLLEGFCQIHSNCYTYCGGYTAKVTGCIRYTATDTASDTQLLLYILWQINSKGYRLHKIHSNCLTDCIGFTTTVKGILSDMRQIHTKGFRHQIHGNGYR